MEINFRTKEESNKLQREEYLKLSLSEKWIYCFRIMKFIKRFPTKGERISDFEFVTNVKKNLDLKFDIKNTEKDKSN